MAVDGWTSCEAGQATLLDRALADNVITTNLMSEEIAKAQLAVRDAFSLLHSITVGDDDGELPANDHTDAVHELIVARRALRHLARIVGGHADDLEALAAADRVAQAQQDGGAE